MSRETPSGVGIDFGTTNSAIAVLKAGKIQLAQFSFMETVVNTYRSVLFFEQSSVRSRDPKPLTGPSAIEGYLEPHEGGRLIQSLKSFAASRAFGQTNVMGKQYKLEDLIGLFLKGLRQEAEPQLGPLGVKAVVGRPVRFVGATTAQEEKLALERLRAAFAIAGFTEVVFEYEPVGAAYAYGNRLSTPELVLIADFGGGTSDFSLLRVHPSGERAEIIGTSGVPVGGDTFDARIVRHLVSPMFGLGTFYTSVGKTLPIPSSVYLKLESWHHLSFLKSQENLRLLQSVRAQAVYPERLDRLIEIVEGDLGYHLHRAVQRTKVELSSQNEAMFSFLDASVDIHQPVERADFEAWIADDLAQIRSSVDELLENTGVPSAQIDRVFLTGGSSMVPAVRRFFEKSFGAHRLAAGEEFVSVAKGLALRAASF
jgi:hypothetical chaperone protein